MRNTESIATLDLKVLATVTGGCGQRKRQCAPQSPPPQQSEGGGTSVEVATGTQGGAMIQQALQGGAMPGAPQPPRMI